VDENRYDRIISKIEKYAGLVNKKIDTEFKNKTPFDMEKMTPDEVIANYLSLDEDVKLELRQDPTWADKEVKIFDMIRRKQGYA